MTNLLDDVEIDFLILADQAEGLNGKLYMMGGGWNERQIVDFNRPLPFHVAVGILVPWDQAFQEHQFSLRLEDEDGRKLPPEFSGTINVGAQPTAVRGQPLRTILVVQGEWTIPSPGTYRMVAAVDGAHERGALFNLRARPGSPAAQNRPEPETAE